ncbi:MAG: sulfite exporter TauE/SafE family protein [Cellvibrionaceae bacterium]
MDQSFHFISAFLMGFFGGMHCIGMCGGISSALGFAVNDQSRLKRTLILLSYNFGRIFTYALMGALVGWVIQLALIGTVPDPHAGHNMQPIAEHSSNDIPESNHSVKTFLDNLKMSRLLAGLLLIAMGLYLAGWWFGLTRLEKVIGGFFWKYLQPIGKKILPVTTITKAILLGLVWGWLPCGLVYTALAFSATQASWLNSAATMFFFGLGTLPFLLASGFFAEELKKLLQRKGLRQVVGGFVLLFGVWTIVGAVGLHSGH